MTRDGMQIGLVVLLLLVTTGCPQQTAVWLAEEATLDRPLFSLGQTPGVSEPIHITVARVDECPVADSGELPSENVASWMVVRESGAPAITTIQYGVVPEGFSETVQAAPLRADGCYVLHISGTGALRFRIDGQGRLVEG